MTFLTTIDVASYPADDHKKLKNAAGKAGKAGKGGKAGNAANAGTDYVKNNSCRDLTCHREFNSCSGR
jgi:hypothetical protein